MFIDAKRRSEKTEKRDALPQSLVTDIKRLFVRCGHRGSHSISFQWPSVDTNILTSVPAMLSHGQLTRKQQIVCITVNQACKIKNLSE